MIYPIYQVYLELSSRKVYFVYEVIQMKKSAYITFRTDEEIKNYLEKLAKREDRTLSYIVNRILEEYIKKKTQA